MVRLILVAGLLAGCHGADVATPPDGDSGSGGDPGLFVQWTSNPTIPDTSGDSPRVEAVSLWAESLRVIGDAGPGDPRTTESQFVVEWSASRQPEPLAFPDAPTGLYSKVSMQLDGHLILPSYRISGHVTLSNNETVAFEIEDRDALALSLAIDRMLPPGGTVNVGLVLELQQAVSSVDFETLPIEDSKRQLDTNNAQMPAFRAKLIESFKIASSNGG